MASRIFVVHGWEGLKMSPWIPWLEKELRKREINVRVLGMPNPDEPYIDDWVDHLRESVENPDAQTIFVGHSIGCQAIMRYAGMLPKGTKLCGAIFVAPWVHLNKAAFETESDEEIAKPWLDTPFNWEAVKERIGKVTAIFSDNDPYVPIADYKIFEKELGAIPLIEHEKGHFDEIPEVPRILSEVLRFVNK